jgi:periplasmic mercuric ion binding protein
MATKTSYFLAALMTFGTLAFSASGQSTAPKPAATAAPKTAQIEIRTSAICGMCKKAIEKAMAYEKGVKAAELDVDTKMLTVVYQPDKTSPDKIRRAVAHTGYDADSIIAEPRAYQRLPECCQKTAAPHKE